MKHRNDAQNLFRGTIDIEKAENYIRRKRMEGMRGFGILCIFIAAYVRLVSQMPGVNRFISGQRIYARNSIDVVMMVKKELNEKGAETSIKIRLEPTDTAGQVYHKLMEEILKNKKESEDNGMDKTADILNKIPRLLLKFSIFALGLMDYFGIMPKSLIEVSPFHGSIFITDLGSLGIPPVYHHLYNFGNVPVFLAFGAKRKQNVLNRNGTVTEKKYVDFTFVSDERTCDGYYFAKALKMLMEILKNPEQLDTPPDHVVQDVE